MTKAFQLIRRSQGRPLTLLGDTRGLSTVEYVIILVLVAVLAIGTWRTFGSSVKTKITESTTAVDGLSAGDGKTKAGQ